ncbi:MAG TPA: ROK family protein [Solirubrobacteraceae bacterium]|nr:ROK family protein [Solirubrobacteraceae bacterium]
MPGRRTIGVDMGGTKLLAGAVDADYLVHRRLQRSVGGLDQSALLESAVQAVQELREPADGEIDAVGFGIPSLIDRRSGRSVVAVHLPLAGVPLADVMAERLGLPVFVDNDANLALLAEHRAGAAQGARHALMITVGTGIGGGLVLDGELYRGAVGAAGELGHITIDLDGPPCHGNCPSRGCLEALASGTALAREARRLAEERPDSGLAAALADGRPLGGALVTELAHDGDPAAREAIERIGTHLGIGIASLLNIFNPEVVVIGGGVIGAGELLLAPARAQAERRALPPSREARIVPAHFGAEAGMVGAAVLAREGVGVAGAGR